MTKNSNLVENRIKNLFGESNLDKIENKGFKSEDI